MPGKYPTINSNLTTRTALTPGGTAGLSNSDKNSLKAMFPNSPIYTINASDYLKVAAGYLQPSTQTGDDVQFPSVNFDYNDAPDLSIAPVGFDSSYYPNLIAASDPAGGEGTATGSPISPNDNFGTGNTVDNVTPHATSAIIAQQSISSELGTLPSLGTDGTQSINPGATGQTTVS